jgi:hypothetical protein
MIMDLIRNNLKTLAEFHEFEIVKNNVEEFIIATPDGDKRSVLALPAKEETTRGVGGTCIICEEAAVMPPKFFVDVVLPVTGPELVSCICISTVKGTNAEGQSNWYSKLMDLTQPDGKSFFNVFQFHLACEKCIKENKAASCTHKLHELPWWQDPSKQMMLRHIMEQLGYGDSAAQELQGVATSNLNTVFPKDKILKLFNHNITTLMKPSDLTEDVMVVFVAIDVSLGGDKSRTSLMSLFPYQGQMMIQGGESIPVKLSEDYRDIIIQHVKHLRTLPKLHHAKVVICLENNTVGVARQVMMDLLALNMHWIHIMEKTGHDITNST